MRYSVSLLLMFGHLLLKRAHTAHARAYDHTNTGRILLGLQCRIFVGLKCRNVSQHRKTIQLALLLEVKPDIRVEIFHLTGEMAAKQRCIKQRNRTCSALSGHQCRPRGRYIMTNGIDRS